jgi:hypothetical protein
MLSAGPSWTFAPFAKNSRPIASPHSRAISGSQADATVSPDGKAVVDPLRISSRNPWDRKGGAR